MFRCRVILAGSLAIGLAVIAQLAEARERTVLAPVPEDAKQGEFVVVEIGTEGEPRFGLWTTNVSYRSR
ncbi:hypothetical protein EH31_12825 [Erythrobacter longus]|uniref:Uncharacterized protein n=1 Tax=Erythrobacter longus TaxID=1044 RepID=A0A074MV90_ERYLO|nr:hypothetical protein EH31_12825 [Erythrobacter longus]